MVGKRTDVNLLRLLLAIVRCCYLDFRHRGDRDGANALKSRIGDPVANPASFLTLDRECRAVLRSTLAQYRYAPDYMLVAALVENQPCYGHNFPYF